MSTSYRRLNIDNILEYTETLSQRIEERFPKRGLTPVSQDLLLVAQNTQAQIIWIARPITYLRIAIGIVVLVMVLFCSAVEKLDTAIREYHKAVEAYDDKEKTSHIQS